MCAKTHFINDQWIDGTGGEFSSADPADETETWRGRAASEREVGMAVEAAYEALEPWSDRAPAERIKFLEAFKERVLSHREQLAEAICRETGKPRWEALAEADAVAGKVAISIEAYQERCRTAFGRLGEAFTAVRYKPQGVVAVIGPFNLPAHLPNGHIVPALLAGNTVVFKPSKQTPLVGEKMAGLWQAAGLPHGVFNLVQGGRAMGATLIKDRRLSGLYFTGSYQTGRDLHKEFAGRPETILALEMGGNNPLVVHEASNLDAAAYLAVQSAFITAGQRCSCARRLIVVKGRQGERFVERLSEMTSGIRIGPYVEIPEPFLGPVISESAADSLLQAQGELKAKGGKVIIEMKRLYRRGWFIEPGLMDVTGVPDRPDKELFGPFLQLIWVKDFDEAVSEANRTCFGLSAGLLSDRKDLYEQFFRRVRAGVINWNRQLTGASGRLPFGGVGTSGNHRPSAYFAADYCSYPIASIETETLSMPRDLTPGIQI